MLRMVVVNQNVSFPENLHDWAWDIARVGAILATLAAPARISLGLAELVSLLCFLQPFNGGS